MNKTSENLGGADGDLTLTLHTRIAELGMPEWDACAGKENPFVGHAFLSALEDSGSVGPATTGWAPRHLAMRDGAGNLVAVVPAYAKAHSYGEYVFDQGWADAFNRAGGAYYPKLQACVPFSPVPGPRLLRRPGADITFSALGGALKQVCSQLGYSSAHITFCLHEESEALAGAGWMQRLGLQYHWHNNAYRTFNDFLAALTANYRKSIRRERRDAQSAGLTFRTLRGGDVKPTHWDAFFRFYQSTVDRKWGSAYLTRDFFALLAERLGDKVVLMLAEHEGAPVAAALNLIGADTLFGRNWGCIGDWPFLHFELCYYRAIDFAIENGLQRVEAGAQGEHKIRRGYLPQRTYSAHWIENPDFAEAVRQFLDRERPAIDADIATLADFSPFRA
jgi:predicted N-acyltransferase